MRIVVVSAHYPPNFVSGGTLQPQRQARALRERGHDVRVFAGWLGERPPLVSWDEVDTTGLPVRWIVTSPWIGWGDRRNWDNPPVADRFASYLKDVKPDIVHFHSLQSLGAGLLPEASKAGAKVAVTMHDFWWMCSRQFLVDRMLRPCSPVVDAGVCACEVDRHTLEARDQALRSMLSHADLVLAPSQAAAQVFLANGVDPRKLVVNENGLPTELRVYPSAQKPSGGSAVRFLYVGGAHPLKGIQVLMDAARSLADLKGWKLVVHGAEDFLAETGTDVTGLPVELRPAFDPLTADAVYAEADVVVVPSVMRETSSLVTREALMRGIPVLCTDTFGPEEVVTDGRNGLIVPAADAAALAAAMTRLVVDPALLQRLHASCQDVPPVPTLQQQVDALTRLFAKVVDGGAPSTVEPALGQRVVRRVLFVCGIDGAPLRYRATLPTEAMALLGVESEIRHYRDPELPELATRADAIVVYRVPASSQVLEFIAGVRKRGIPVFFDVDDLIFDPGLEAEIPALQILPPDEAALWLQGVRRYRMTMDACDAYIGSTALLCRHAEAVTGLPAERFPNGVGLRLARLSDQALGRPRRPGPLRIGYLSGSNTHDHDWRLVEDAVAVALDRHPAELWLVGHVPPSPSLERFGDRVVRRPSLPWIELPDVLRGLDVNLAPLVANSRFNEAKSAIKWLEAALTATPTIASPTEPFREAVSSGRNGWLAANDAEWVEALDLLLSDAEMRRALGQRARRDALLRYSPHVQGRRYLEILEEGRLRRDAPRQPAWPADVLDEPPEPTHLDDQYGGPAVEAPPDQTIDRPDEHPPASPASLRTMVQRAWATTRDEGPAAAAHRAARRLKLEVGRATSGRRSGPPAGTGSEPDGAQGPPDGRPSAGSRSVARRGRRGGR